jgi:hypothetical protein
MNQQPERHIVSSMAEFHIEGRRPVRGRRASEGVLLLAMLVLISLGLTALGFVAYALWPRWPEPAAATDAPSLPITVAGVPFNVPPQAMRIAAQRAPGAQARIDLAYLWPSLVPPTKAAVPSLSGRERIFITIAVATSLAPLARLKGIYPRYVAPEPMPGPPGLALYAFRDGTPYQGEDPAFDTGAPEKFLARCSRSINPLTPGTCLAERRIGAADLTMRFPREWLKDWRDVETGLEKLIAACGRRADPNSRTYAPPSSPAQAGDPIRRSSSAAAHQMY